MSDIGSQSDGRRRLFGFLGILIGGLLGLAIVVWRRDGEVDWARLLPIAAGIPIGGGLVALWLSRK